MAIFKCKMCGGDLNISADDKIVECEYCGTTQTVPSADNEKKMTLFNRANRLRLNSEFDKAAVLYEQIIAEFPEEAEAYWGLCLCNYGIEYVDDPATGKKIPTCHRASFQKLREDENFTLAMEYSDAVAQKVYRDEAREIDRINAEILSVSRNEKPYDVFICYKETDDFGGRTPDSVMAQEVYDALTDKGYKVFFSRITLEDKLGLQYEPYIFAALNSAKVMLAFGTKYEYFHAVWVKNEWSRFLKLASKDKTKKLVPVYKDMDPYDLPDEFKALQAQDMSKLGAVQDLVRGVEKLLTTDSPILSNPASQMDLQGKTNVTALMERGFMALEDGEWKSADDFFEEALNQDAKNAGCYLGKLMAKLRVHKREQLKEVDMPFDDDSNCKKASRFDAGIARELEEINAVIRERNEAERNSRRKILRTVALHGNHTVGIREDGTVIATGEDRDGQCDVRNWKNIVAVAAGYYHTVGLCANDTVVATGSNNFHQCDVSDWTDVVSICAGSYHTVGLCGDGSVVATGNNNGGRCDVNGWTGIIAIDSGDYHTVGLRSDGTVIATGTNNDGRCNVENWTDVVSVAAGGNHTVGLRKDGSVIVTKDQDKVKDWNEILSIAAGGYHTIGLRKDGTVKAAGSNAFGQCDVTSWSNIAAVDAGFQHTVGLRADGTVVATGNNDDGRCNVTDWTNIVGIVAGNSQTIGIRADGTIVAVGKNESGQCRVQNWRNIKLH